MAKPVLYSGDIHGAILRGVNKVADAARLTLGPRGSHGSDAGEGLVIVKGVQLSDPVERIGAQMLREVATRTARVVRDGTATATVLARAIYREGAKRVRAGADPLEVRRGIHRGVTAALAALDRIARPVKGEDVARVATLLAGHDEEIAGPLVQAIRGVGAEGAITIEEARGPESPQSTVELVRRTSFDTTLLSSYFAADSGQVETVLEHPKVLVCDRELCTAKELLPVLKRAARQGRPLLVVARDVKDEALFTLVANRLRGVLEVAAVMAPGSGARRTAGLRDLAALTGAKVLSSRTGPVRWEDLGEARRAVPTELYTTIFTDAGDAERDKAMDRRLRQIRGRLAKASSAEKWALQQRLTQVEGTRVALVQVGGAAAERERRRARIETALDTTRAAVRDGIVPGGGLALLRAIPVLADLLADGETPGDVQAGIDVVRRALEEPARRIAENAGRKGSDTVRRLLATEGSVGYNAATGRYEDLIAAGIVDPLKVTRTALLTAASIASATLTAEAMISERKVLAAAADRGAGIPVYSVPDGRMGGSSYIGGVFPEPPSSTQPKKPVSTSTPHPQPQARSEVREAPNKEINLWIDERQDDPSEPLYVDNLYTLNINVGALVQGNLAMGQNTSVPLADIPPKGLKTAWVISSDSVELKPGSPGVKVTSEVVGSSERWHAKFPLLIPRKGDSPVVRLRIKPLRKKNARIQVLVSARGEAYRQFEITLHTESGKPLPNNRPVAMTREMVYKLPGELGLRPARGWARPPGAVTITVMKGDCHLLGKAPTQKGLWEPDESIQWPPPNAMLAERIQQVRASAEAFRAEWQHYLDDLPKEDFVSRLPVEKNWFSSLGLSPGHRIPKSWTQLPDHADEAHRRLWEKVAVSEELRALAFDGYALYQALFPAGSDLRSRLDGLRPGVRININWTDSVGPAWIAHVPWGLMYTEPVGGNPPDPLKFWGLRYRIGYVPYQAKSSVGALGSPENVYAAHCLYWGEDPPGEEAQWQRTTGKYLPKQVSIPAGASGAGAKEQLRKLLESPDPRPMAILYFFCRTAQGSGPNDLVLRFANSTRKEDTLVRTEMGQEALPERPFVFANACVTAASGDVYIANELERTFIKDRGCRAFLGTETKVPVVLASRFAAVFFHFFYRQVDPAWPVSAGEAVAQARLFLWTHYRNLGGLFYCLVNKYDLFLADEQEVLSLGS